MSTTTFKKYAPFIPIQLESRQWPNQHISKAPLWCSVDLRDGNQSLINPMSIKQKIDFFNTLVEIGFKHIEVGFPAASITEFEFVRHIIDEGLIPNDVHIQVLTQAREHLIKRTLESIQGAPHAIVHLYNSTSIAQRHYVFNKSKSEIIQIALDGLDMIRKYHTKYPTPITLEYSPESFTGTEIEFSMEICNAVIDTWQSPMIINLPATVELFTPNIYADMIEYASNNLHRRDDITLSLHTHNDRGTCTAATELALLAGADRVEGTLFGNGERTGNCDITTVALNLMMHGIDPKLELSNLNELEGIYHTCTGMNIHPRHPYAGSLVFTAFSGSHQDAIKKGMAQYQSNTPWDVPYLAIDPEDIGKQYEAIIRINSQSGKGGVAYILEHDFQCVIPKEMQPEVAKIIQHEAEQSGHEIKSQQIWDTFNQVFINCNAPLLFKKINTQLHDDTSVEVVLNFSYNSNDITATASGNGPIDATKKALEYHFSGIKIHSYSEHSLAQGSDSKAICYLKISYEDITCYGVGIDSNITLASVKAIFSAMNRILKGKQ